MLVVDLETTGLDPHSDRIVGYGVNEVWCTEPGWIRPTLDGKGLTCHNGNFDIKFIWNAGAVNAYVEFDTMIAAYLLKNRPESLSLGSCAEFYLGESSEWKGEFKGSLAMPLADLERYCMKDVAITRRLREVLELQLKEQGVYDFFTKLMKARNLLSRAELKGMSVNWGALVARMSQLEADQIRILELLNKEFAHYTTEWKNEQVSARLAKLKRPEKAKPRDPDPFNWSSPKQVLWLLRNIGADSKKWDFKEKQFKESASTDVLEKNLTRFPALKPLIELRSAEKTLGMLKGYQKARNPVTDNLHGKFNLTVTATGRLSSSEPNLQNIDSGPTIRSLFVPSPGKVFVIADLAQIEVRMAAHYSQDPLLINMFKDGLDFYGTIATEVLKTPCTPNEVKEKFPEDRKVAKVIGLSILYGTGAKRLQAAIKQGTGRDYSESECKQIIENYFRRFKGLKSLQERVEKVLLKRGYLINLFGRKLYVSPEDIYINGVNYLLQSSASDLMLLRQLEIDNNRSSLVALVHDEVIRECDPKEVDFVKSDVETALERIDDIGFRVPLKTEAKVCNNWAEGK